jgi:hypothetical protein
MARDRFRWTRAAQAALALTLVFAPCVNAGQAPATAQARGMVNDSIGAPLPGAVVTIEDASRAAWFALSGPDGRYRIEQMPPGPYTMTVTFPGFRDYAVPIELRPGQTTSTTANLKIAFAESIEVRQSLSDPRRNPSTVILSGRDIEFLPAEETLLLERLAQLAGATRPGDVAIYVDGFREYQRVPLKSTIDVIRINSNPFSAEYAAASARRIEITTRAGSDTFHGSTRVELRDSHLNARAPLEPELVPMRYGNINGYLQGPLSKGRASFLVYGGVWQQNESAIVRSTIIDPLTNAAQPFSQSVASPLRQTSVVGKLDFAVLGQRVNAMFMRNAARHQNLGLESGFALPEHAYGTQTADQTGRVWWTSVGKRSINDMRVQFSRADVSSTPLSAGPEVIVLDAFTGGGSQEAAGRRTTSHLQAVDTFTYQSGRHLFKSGVEFNLLNRQSTDRAGFGGTFIFGSDVERDAAGRPVNDATGAPIAVSPIEAYRRTVLGLAGYGPSQYAVVRGNADVQMTEWNAGAFIVDDWTVSKSLSVALGLRHDLQSTVGARLALAPRGYVSWVIDPAGKRTLRAGAGVFYAPIDTALAFNIRRLDGTHQQRLVVSNPAFFPAAPSADSLPGTTSATSYTQSPGLRMPRTIRTSVSFEDRLSARLVGTVEYTYDRGSGLLRSRILPGDTRALQLESTGQSDEHALLATLRGNVGTSTFSINYTLARRRGNTDGAETVMSDVFDPAADYGALGTDRRHTFTAGATLVFPKDVYVSPFVTFASGRPFNITTGRDTNGDTTFVDRPAFASADDPAAISTPYGRLTPAPAPGMTVVPRNFGRDPGQVSFSVSAAKMFKNGLAFNADVDNVFNRNRLVGTNGVITSPVFGTPNRSLSGRRITLGARYSF